MLKIVCAIFLFIFSHFDAIHS